MSIVPAAPPAIPPAPSTPRARALPMLLGFLLIVAIALRVAIVTGFHAPAGDGVQYLALAHELAEHGRYALAAPPAPLTFVRMPGYPLFLAWVAIRQALPIEEALVVATRWNVALDVGTAALLYLLLRRSARRAAILVVGLVLACPLLALVSAYALTETLATFLTVAQVLLLCLALEGEHLLPLASGAGALAGLSLLTRTDAVTVAPAALLALVVLARAPLVLRLRAAALWALFAAAVFAPWPARNLVRFGEAHPGAVAWRAANGAILPTEIYDWERTWATSAPGESYLDVPIVFGANIDPRRPGIVLPQMYDSEAERLRVVALFERYNRERLSDGVRADLAQLARERRARAPLRTFVWLPLCRIAHLFLPVPEWELPLRLPWLGLPKGRPLFSLFDAAVYLLALVGAYRGLRQGGLDRARVLVFLAVLGGRIAVFSFAIPNATTQRYLVEAYPLLLALAALALAPRSPAAPGRSAAANPA